jgi:hypothetical protein
MNKSKAKKLTSQLQRNLCTYCLLALALYLSSLCTQQQALATGHNTNKNLPITKLALVDTNLIQRIRSYLTPKERAHFLLALEHIAQLKQSKLREQLAIQSKNSQLATQRISPDRAHWQNFIKASTADKPTLFRELNPAQKAEIWHAGSEQNKALIYNASSPKTRLSLLIDTAVNLKLKDFYRYLSGQALKTLTQSKDSYPLAAQAFWPELNDEGKQTFLSSVWADPKDNTFFSQLAEGRYGNSALQTALSAPKAGGSTLRQRLFLTLNQQGKEALQTLD